MVASPWSLATCPQSPPLRQRNVAEAGGHAVGMMDAAVRETAHHHFHALISNRTLSFASFTWPYCPGFNPGRSTSSMRAPAGPAT